jgi:hypothetical protein
MLEKNPQPRRSTRRMDPRRGGEAKKGPPGKGEVTEQVWLCWAPLPDPKWKKKRQTFYNISTNLFFLFVVSHFESTALPPFGLRGEGEALRYAPFEEKNPQPRRSTRRMDPRPEAGRRTPRRRRNDPKRVEERAPVLYVAIQTTDDLLSSPGPLVKALSANGPSH